MIFTADLDVPSLTAAMKLLGWDFPALAAEAKVPPDHLDGLMTGCVFHPRSVRRIIETVNDALAARGLA